MAIKFTHEAYCAIFLHACKHPTRAVNGLLLGSAADDGLTVRKVLPLFHSSFALSPMLEVALMLADQYCKANDTRLIGYYQGNELSDDTELGPFGKKIAEKLRSQCPRAAVLLLDGASMQPTATELRLLPLGVDGKRCSLEIVLMDAEKTIAALDGYISEGVQQKLVDFDSHLDDASKDWLDNQRFFSA